MRNNNLDILKVVMAFLVVALHIFPVSKLEGLEGLISYEIASGITRIAVPTFLLISGFLLRNKLNDTTYLWKYIKRILLIYVVWQIIYLPDLIRCYNLGWFHRFEMILKLIYGYWHLWYLLASVVAVGLLYLVRNTSVYTKWALIISLLTVGYVFQVLIQSDVLHCYLDVQFVYSIIGTTRNFLFFGFPMMLIGSLYEQWFAVINKYKKAYFILWILLLAEVCCYYQFKVKAMDFLLVLPLLSMFTLVVVTESKQISSMIVNPTLSLGIYLVHPYAIRLVYEFLPQKEFGFVIIKYLLVCCTAVIFWWILDKINKKVSFLF